MHLAINYSPAAAGLVRTGSINIDYFKVPDWEWLIDEAKRLRPVAVHFTLDAGNGGLDEKDWGKVKQLAQATETPYVNLHLDARQRYYPGLAVDTDKADEVESVFRIILTDVMTVVKLFGAEQVIIENSCYQKIEGNTMRLCTEPGLISRLVEETGCGLLLDIAHAIIAARSLGMTADEYILQLPVKRVKEMHFAGIHNEPGTGLLKDHLSIQEKDWYWLDWALEQVRVGKISPPWLLAFEYGGVGKPFEGRSEPEVIAAQVPILYEHIKILRAGIPGQTFFKI